MPYKACKLYYDTLGLQFQKYNDAQFEVVQGDERFPVVIGGERGGKSFVSAAILVPHIEMLPEIRRERFYTPDGKLKFDWKDRTDRPLSPDFVIFGPTYAEPRVEFAYVEEWLRKLDDIARVSKPTDGPWRLITKAGVVLTTWSTDNPMSIRGIDLEGALAVEAGAMEWDAIERIQGRIGAKRGFCIYNGCLRGDSIVQTSNGFLTLRELYGSDSFLVRNRNGENVPVSQSHFNGVFPTKKVKLQFGLEIEGTYHHKVQVHATAQAGRRWKQLDELSVGDKVYLALNTNLFGENVLPPDVAYLSGLYLGDGNAEVGKRGGARITITAGEDEVETHEFLTSLGFKKSGQFHWRSSANTKDIKSSGIDLNWKSGNKEIPKFIRSADKETIKHFLSGLFDADGCALKNGNVTLTSKSRIMLEQVQSILLGFGIVGGISEKRQRGIFPQGSNNNEYTGYTLSIAAGKEFQEKIGFRLSRKASRCLLGGKAQRLFNRQTTDNQSTYGDIYFARVLSVEDSECATYDLSVPNKRSYTANGVITHNTMENAKQWYVKWSMEGKRDNRFRIKTYSIPSWSNKHEFPEGYETDEIQRWKQFYPDDVFMTRVAAEPQPPRYRVLKEFEYEHIRAMKFPRNEDGTYACNFEIWIDPGYQPSAYAVLWVAWWETDKGRFFYVFDEFYEQEVITPVMIERIKKHKFYRYVENDGIVIDISAKRHADGNEPALDIYKKMTGKQPYTKYWHENASIERIRTTAKSGMIAIHPNCMGLIAEIGLGDYPRFPEMHPWKFPTGRDGTIIGDKPTDEWNHSAKALAYGLLRRQGLVERMGTRPEGYNRIKGKTSRKAAKNSYLRKGR